MAKWSKAKKMTMKRRRLATGNKTTAHPRRATGRDAPLAGRVKILGTTKVNGVKCAEVSCPRALSTKGAGLTDPVRELGRAIADGIDPTRVCGPVKRLVDMSAEERSKLEAQYGAPIKQAQPRQIDPTLLVPVAIEQVVCRGITDGGMRISYQGKGQWIPKSVLLKGSVLHTPGCSGTIVVPRWFALKRGLITGLNGLAHEERDAVRDGLMKLIAEWRKRIREEDVPGEFYRGVRIAMRACALELIKVIKATGGAAFYEQKKLETHYEKDDFEQGTDTP
jgi:hypothetical protein